MRVTPRSSRNHIEVAEDGTVKVWVTASPTDGQANLAVCEILAKKLGIAKSLISIASGDTSRNKQVIAQGLSQDEAFSLLRST